VHESGRFDAAVHQAVERIETANEPEGTILATLRRGYTLGSQILRAAHVRVAAPASSDAPAGTN
jgi:molecular chaperone GrpE (heat shock protein)